MTKQSSSKQSKSNVRVSRATKAPAPAPATATAATPTLAPRAQEQLDAKRIEAGKTVDKVGAALNAGQRLTFPKGANAVKAGYAGGKSTVVLKGDADTLKNTGVETATFGNVPNDSKGHPQREKFQPLTGAVATAKPAKTAKAVEKPDSGAIWATLQNPSLFRSLRTERHTPHWCQIHSLP